MINKYLEYIGLCSRDIPTTLLVGLILVFCLGMALLLTVLGVKKGLKWAAGLMLLEYAVLLVFMAVLARKVQVERAFDFTPFWSYRAIREGAKALFPQIVANVVAFIPIGFLLGCAFGRLKWWRPLLIGTAFSLLIETLQFLLRRGFAEFDDVFHNVVGCMIGWGVYVLIAWIVDKSHSL